MPRETFFVDMDVMTSGSVDVLAWNAKVPVSTYAIVAICKAYIWYLCWALLTEYFGVIFWYFLDPVSIENQSGMKYALLFFVTGLPLFALEHPTPMMWVAERPYLGYGLAVAMVFMSLVDNQLVQVLTLTIGIVGVSVGFLGDFVLSHTLSTTRTQNKWAMAIGLLLQMCAKHTSWSYDPLMSASTVARLLLSLLALLCLFVCVLFTIRHSPPLVHDALLPPPVRSSRFCAGGCTWLLASLAMSAVLFLCFWFLASADKLPLWLGLDPQDVGVLVPIFYTLGMGLAPSVRLLPALAGASMLGLVLLGAGNGYAGLAMFGGLLVALGAPSMLFFVADEAGMQRARAARIMAVSNLLIALWFATCVALFAGDNLPGLGTVFHTRPAWLLFVAGVCAYFIPLIKTVERTRKLLATTSHDDAVLTWIKNATEPVYKLWPTDVSISLLVLLAAFVVPCIVYRNLLHTPTWYGHPEASTSIPVALSLRAGVPHAAMEAGGMHSPVALGAGQPVGALTVLQWNVQQGYNMAGRFNGEQVADTVREFGATVLTLQECDTSHMYLGTKDLLGYLSHELRMNLDRGVPSMAMTTGSAIMSTLPLRPVLSTNLETGDCAGCVNRAFTHAEVEVNGTRVGVFTIHMEYFNSTHALLQAWSVRNAVDNYCRQRSPCPVILTGDMNNNCTTATHCSAPINVMRCANASCTDGSPACCQQPLEVTSCMAGTCVDTERALWDVGMKRLGHIDFIFHRDIRRVEGRVLADIFPPHACVNEPHRCISDHLPVLARFVL